MDTVLLVDDEYWALIGIQKLFQWDAYGFQITHAVTSSEEAYRLISTEKPDVVFTDIRMPEISGIELMKLVRGEGIDTEFVIISGFGEFIYAQEALQQGAVDYRLKPLSFEDAEDVLKNLRRRLDEKRHYYQQRETVAFQSAGNEHFQKLLEYVDTHYREPVYLKDLSSQFYINETYCSELFKKHTGKNFSDYVNQRRIADACGLLAGTGGTIEQISQQVGFQDYYYFNKVFKKYMEVTPAQYRKNGAAKEGGGTQA